VNSHRGDYNSNAGGRTEETGRLHLLQFDANKPKEMAEVAANW